MLFASVFCEFFAGEVLELRGKKAIVKIGFLSIRVAIDDLTLVKEKKQRGKIITFGMRFVTED